MLRRIYWFSMKLMASLAPAQAEIEAGVVAKADQLFGLKTEKEKTNKKYLVKMEHGIQITFKLLIWFVLRKGTRNQRKKLQLLKENCLMREYLEVRNNN